MDKYLEQVLRGGVIVIVRGQKPQAMRPFAEALYAGGISLIEVTFDQQNPDLWQDTTDSIRMLAERFAGRVLPGAGTVITPEQVQLAHDAGARYIISPNVDPDVIKKTKQLGMLSIPGAFTPSEILQAHNAGADIVKLFPAAQMGASYIKAIRAPISHVRMMAVGGITEQNAAEFMRAGCVGVGVGGSIVNKDLIEAGAWDQITQIARAYVKAVRG